MKPTNDHKALRCIVLIGHGSTLPLRTELKRRTTLVGVVLDWKKTTGYLQPKGWLEMLYVVEIFRSFCTCTSCLGRIASPVIQLPI